jgi:ribokinase
LGSINVDLTARASRLPRPGETVSGHRFSIEAGGKGANQALAARRAGAKVRFVGAVGEDAFAGSALALLDKENVDIAGVRRAHEVTGTALISVGEEGENSIIVTPGANGTLTTKDAEDAVATMSSNDILMVQLEVPANVVKAALIAARSRGIKSVLNTAPLVQNAPEIARWADFVIANETEFETLVGQRIPNADRERIMTNMFPASGQTFVVTLGENGAISIHSGKIYRARGLKITPVDTVGAGDTFCGYLGAGLLDGLEFSDILQRAAIAGSLACLHSGAQNGIPYASEIHGHRICSNI